MSIKEIIRAEIERRMDKHWDLLPNADSPEDDWTHNELCELGAFKELEYLEQFLDTLEEPENPIYELNQFLINWVRDGQTDAEKDARWEAYRRFFELHDEAMMQEPNAADKKAVKEIVKTVHKEVTRQVKEMVKEQPASEGLEEEIKRMVYDVVYDLDGPAIMGTSKYLSVEDIAYIARHFAEWGLNARKEARPDD